MEIALAGLFILSIILHIISDAVHKNQINTLKAEIATLKKQEPKKPNFKDYPNFADEK